MPINYYKKSVYGVEVLYIIEPKVAEAVGMLTGKKTIDTRDMHALAILGHTLIHTPIN